MTDDVRPPEASPPAITEWRVLSDDELTDTERAQLADPETRRRILANPKVQAGLNAYFERHKRYGGKVPTISAEKVRQMLADRPSVSPEGAGEAAKETP